MRSLTLSVRAITSHLFRSGSLGTGNMSRSRALMGQEGHLAVQARRTTNYESEVSVVWSHAVEEFDLTVRGRIDGVYTLSDGVIVEEIKTTALSLKELQRECYPAHWAQAFFYAYFYCCQKELQEIGVQLTYYQLETGATREFFAQKTVQELETFCYAVLHQYLQWSRVLIASRERRDDSLRTLSFPFDTPREGQLLFMEAVEQVLSTGGQLFAEAPTGTGKTVATLYPALKGILQENLDTLYYLTAKTVGREVAQNTLALFREQGLHAHCLTLTAKEKICFNEEVNCAPEKCPWSKGHFDRITGAVEAIYPALDWTRSRIEAIAREHQVCPFDLSLELATYADVVICDYNYVYDPRVFLRHLFADDTRRDVFLVDEAHNLVDRAREMYSAQLEKREVLAARRLVKPLSKGLGSILTKVNQLFLDRLNGLDEKGFAVSSLPTTLLDHLESYCRAFESFREANRARDLKALEPLLEFYFRCYNFVSIGDLAQKEHVTWHERERRNLRTKIFCMDPSRLLREHHTWAHATIFFSATLSPADYFVDLLGGDEESHRITLPSPFPRDNLLLLLNDRVGTTWKKRAGSYDTVAQGIAAFVKERAGNYLVFFPSFAYLEEVARRVTALVPGIPLISQERAMSEEAREAFLERFAHAPGGLLAFAVMGGVFGEGIDLRGELCIGAVIVGVGLPGVSGQQNLIRDYFDEKTGLGFQYAYQYPGFIRVMQSLGRVIRSGTERGAVLLMDERFGWSQYRKLFPDHWSHYRVIRNVASMRSALAQFWDGHPEEIVVEYEEEY